MKRGTEDAVINNSLKIRTVFLTFSFGIDIEMNNKQVLNASVRSFQEDVNFSEEGLLWVSLIEKRKSKFETVA